MWSSDKQWQVERPEKSRLVAQMGESESEEGLWWAEQTWRSRRPMWHEDMKVSGLWSNTEVVWRRAEQWQGWVVDGWYKWAEVSQKKDWWGREQTTDLVSHKRWSWEIKTWNDHEKVKDDVEIYHTEGAHVRSWRDSNFGSIFKRFQIIFMMIFIWYYRIWERTREWCWERMKTNKLCVRFGRW